MKTDRSSLRAGLGLGVLVVCLGVASLAAAQTPSTGWNGVDIGEVYSGWETPALDGFSVHAAGSDIWDLTDEFRFVYQPLTGDGTIVTRVENFDYQDSWSKAGVMIRESLSSNSKHAFLLLSGTEGLGFQRRNDTGGWTSHTYSGWSDAPVWLKLERRGNVFTASYSRNGNNWTEAGSDTIPMTGGVYIGVALTSHVPWAYASADFTNLEVSVAPVGSGDPAPAGSADTWTSADIGVNLSGTTYWTGSAWAIKGSGADVWDSSDQFRFLYRLMTGDGAIFSRIDNFDVADTWSKAGVMIRESLSANSKHAFMLLSGGGTMAFQRRTSTGGGSVHTGGPWRGAPVWVKLQRQGSTLTGSYSPDGVSWTTLGSDTVSMNSTVYMGFAVTSHAPWAYASANFSSFDYGASFLDLIDGVSDLIGGGGGIIGDGISVLNPRYAVFNPSSNQATAVTHYVLDLFLAGGDPATSNPVASLNLGLPPIVNGECRVEFTSLLNFLPDGLYFATVTAVGSGGNARSEPSGWFSR